MTAISSYGFFDQSTDAAFQSWVTEFKTMLDNAGLTQTADTGQINPATVTRAAADTSAGYLIYRFNDTAQSTAPIFLKFEFGSSGTASTSPGMAVTIGTGSNGTGTITNIIGVRLLTSIAGQVTGTASATQQFLSQCVYNTTTGHFGMFFKQLGFVHNTFAKNLLSLVICRSCNSVGAPTADGVLVLRAYSSVNGNDTTSSFCYAFATGFTVSDISPTSSNVKSGVACWIPQDISNGTLYNGQAQAFRFFTVLPDIAPVLTICNALTTELPQGATFTGTLMGTAHRYLAVRTPRQGWNANADINWGLCILFE